MSVQVVVVCAVALAVAAAVVLGCTWLMRTRQRESHMPRSLLPPLWAPCPQAEHAQNRQRKGHQVTLPADSAASDEAEGPCGTSTSKDSGSSSKKRVSKERRGNNQRWWTELCDLCPISGFPIARLPYPPFKLQMGKGQKFFDGQFLLLQLLSSFNFEVLGRSLTHSEMQALDVHVKKCKLSPFRITRALELVGQGDLPAQQEMTELRTKASKKLGALKHIQRARLQRGDCSAAVAPGPLSRKLG